MNEEPVLNAMTELLAAATSLFTWVMTQLGTVVTTITGSPLLLLGFLMALVGLTYTGSTLKLCERLANGVRFFLANGELRHFWTIPCQA